VEEDPQNSPQDDAPLIPNPLHSSGGSRERNQK
jgi:hypothetical protein